MHHGRSLFLLVLVALTLSGCRLAITVTGDGDLKSSSGLYDCAAGQSCELEIPEGPFSEDFTAIAGDGYRFALWYGWASLCGGSPDPSCSVQLEPDATELDGAVELNPVFRKAIVGTWLLEDEQGPHILTFFQDGNYVLSETQCDDDEGVTNPGGGFELGSYEWDPKTSDLTLLENRFDSLGSCGLQDVDDEPNTITANVGEEVLELVFQDPEEGVRFTRVHPQSAEDNTGTWVTDPDSDTAELVTFFGESQVMLSSYCPGPDGEAGVLGIELGTYTRDGDEFIFTLDIDTNGECGIADPEQGNVSEAYTLRFMLGSMYIIEEDDWDLAPGLY